MQPISDFDRVVIMICLKLSLASKIVLRESRNCRSLSERKSYLLENHWFFVLNPGASGKFDLRGRQTVAKTQHRQK